MPPCRNPSSQWYKLPTLLKDIKECDPGSTWATESQKVLAGILAGSISHPWAIKQCLSPVPSEQPLLGMAVLHASPPAYKNEAPLALLEQLDFALVVNPQLTSVRPLHEKNRCLYWRSPTTQRDWIKHLVKGLSLRKDAWSFLLED